MLITKDYISLSLRSILSFEYLSSRLILSYNINIFIMKKKRLGFIVLLGQMIILLYISRKEQLNEKNNEFDPLIIHIDDFMFVIFFRFS